MFFEASRQFAIFGGSFSPVHRGHVALARALAALPQVHQVLVIPARRSPFKHNVPLLPESLRWAMLRRALAGVAGVSLLDLELRRPPPSYTWDTLAALETRYPQARFALVLGEDALQGFAGWRQAAGLLARCELLVTRRAGTPAAGVSGAAGVAALAHLLPPPWNAQARAADAQTLADPQGRALLRLLAWDLPDCASSRILAQRDATDVPPGSRELLEAHWRAETAGEG